MSLNAAGDRLAVGANYDGGSGNVASGSGAVYLFTAATETGPYPASVGSTFGSRSEQSITVWASDLVTQLKAGTSVTLQASNDIRLSTILNVVPTGATGGNLTLQAGRSVYLDYALTTGNGNLTLIGNDLLANGVIDLYRDSGTAVINTGSINTGTGSLTVDLRSGAGKTYSTAGAISLGAVTAGALTITSAAPSATGSVQLSSSTIAGNLSVTANGAILGSAGALSVGGTTTVSNKFSTNTASVTLSDASNSFAGQVSVSSGGDIDLFNSGALNLGATHADGTLRVTNWSGNITINGAIDSSKIAIDAVTIKAGYQAFFFDPTGGDLVLGSGSISVAAGARATLYTGTLAGSSSTAAAIGIGSGRFRYGSDDMYSAFSNPLGSGLYLIYREQPTLSVTVDSKSITYGQSLPSLTGTITSGSLRNGDTASYAVAGSALSAAGFIKANSYSINESGLGELGYSLNLTSGTLTVAKKTLTASGLSASNKTYDATLGATVAGTAVLTSGAATDVDGLFYGADTVSVTGTASGAFATKDAATGKSVTVSGLSLAGGDAANYQLDTISLTADIAKKTLSISGLTASNKTYDAGLGATVTGTAAIASGAATSSDGLYYGTDTVALSGTASGSFATKDAGTGKTVTVSGLTLAGVDSANYQLGAISLTADILKKTLTVSGLSASNKTYDAGLGATVTGTAALTSGAVTSVDGLYYGTDTVSLTGTASGAFATKDAATGKTVTVSGLTLAGGDSSNYQLDTISLTADIAQRAIGVRGNDQSKVEGTSDPALSYSVTSGSLAGSDAFTGSLTRASGETIGNYQISVGTLSAGANYLTTFTPGSFSVLAASSGVSDVSLFTNPLWRIYLGDELDEVVARRPRIIWPSNNVRGEQIPAVKGADRGSDIIIRTTPLSRVETISK